MKLIAQQNFSWAHQHVNVKEYTAGEEIETDDADLIEVAQREGWAMPGGEGSEAAAQAKRGKKSAPENKSEAAAPENK